MDKCFPVWKVMMWIKALVKYLAMKKKRAADEGQVHKVEDLFLEGLQVDW